MAGNLVIAGREFEHDVVQGGMGLFVSGPKLVSEVTLTGGLGVLSGIFPELHVYLLTGMKPENAEGAIVWLVKETKKLAKGGPIGINFMGGLRDYEASVRAAVRAGVDFIIVGAAVPRTLPGIVKEEKENADVGLIAIGKSVRVFESTNEHWERRYGWRMNAFVHEGPLAGGHSGFTAKEIFNDNFKLEKLFSPVKDYAISRGNIPVIPAGGIRHDNKQMWREMGADGTQHGTDFLASVPSGASEEFKNAVIACQEEDILIADSKAHNDKRFIQPGSPARHLFRVIRPPQLGYPTVDDCVYCPILRGGKCATREIEKEPDKDERFFCIGPGLAAATEIAVQAEKNIGYKRSNKPIFTVGARAPEINRIKTVEEIMLELTGQIQPT